MQLHRKSFITGMIALSAVLMSGTLTQAQTGPTYTATVFASGVPVGATGPDPIEVTPDGSIWVSYINGADSTGGSGSSNVVQYDQFGNVIANYPIAGSVDGLRFDPVTGFIWAMQNQDGNSTLTLIDYYNGITPYSPLNYQIQIPGRGYDDAAFTGTQVFLSYTNPTGPSDPTIQLLDRYTYPFQVSTVLTQGATGHDLIARVANQPTAQNDPDSIKLTPNGDLMLTSGDDGQLIFVYAPATANQAVGFLQLSSGGAPVSGLDDAIFVTATSGTFYLSDSSNNRVLAIQASGLTVGSLYASVGSLNAWCLINTATGVATPVISGLHGPHGMAFVPAGQQFYQF